VKKILSIITIGVIILTLTGCELFNASVNEAPVITGSNYIILEKDSEEPDWTEYVTATDPEEGDIRITTSMIDASNVNMNVVGIYQVEYFVSDSEGKTTLFILEVEILDYTVPGMALIGPEEVTIEVYGIYAELGAIINDEDGNPLEYEIIGEVNTSALGEYILEYKVIGLNFSIFRKVIIVDTTGPVVNLNVSEFMYVMLGATFNDPWVTVEDNYYSEGLNVTYDGFIDINTVGVYVLSYTATDPAGNTGETVIRTVTVIDGEFPMFMINGDSDITVECGVVYDDLGAYIIVEEGMFDPEVVSTVDATVPGDYSVTYTYTDDDSVVHTLVRTVHIVDTTAPVITLNGDADIIVEYGDAYTELSATIEDNYDTDLAVVIDDDNLDINTLGTYEVYYNITDTNGNVADTVTRTVQVVYHTPSAIISNFNETNKSIDFTLDIEDIDTILTSLVLTIKQGETVIETINLSVGNTPVNLVDLMQNTEYVVEITGSYDIGDGNGVQDNIFYTEIITTDSTHVPSWSLISDDRTANTLEVFLDFIDYDNIMGDTYIVLYLEGVEVHRILAINNSDSYTFSGLTNPTEYEIKLETSYDLNDGNGVIEKDEIIKDEFFTLPDGPPIISFTAAIDNSFIGDMVIFELEIDNPDNLPVYSIIVNGIEIKDFRDGSTNTLLIFAYPTADTTEIQTFAVEQIKVYYSNTINPYTLAENNNIEIQLIEQIKVLSIAAINGEDTAEILTYLPCSITLENNENYVVESITIGGIKYNREDFVSVTATSITLDLFIRDHEGIQFLNVTGLEYSDSNVTKNLNGLLNGFAIYAYRDLNITYIDSIEDLQNIEVMGYYVLTTDLDLSGINWEPIDVDFYGYFDGNGHVISNMTINMVTFFDLEYSIGLFRFSHGFITNLGLTDVNIDIQFLSETTENPTFVGGIVGTSSEAVITKSYVTGIIKVKSLNQEIHVGSIAGGFFGVGYMSEVYSKGKIIIDSDNDFRVGGLTSALAWGTDYSIVKNAYSEVNISLTSEQGSVGGIVGQIHRGPVLIENVYYIGTIEVVDENWNIFGLIGYDDDWGGLTFRNAYGFTYYLFENWSSLYTDEVDNCYLIGDNISSTGFESNITINAQVDITILTSMTEFNPEADLGWDPAIWDFTTEHPTLKNVDNTPTYTVD
jgi:hypothetical protein